MVGIGRYEDLKGKRALVTGGSGGIGKATALALGSNGVRVAIMGRNKDRLDRVVKDLPGGLSVVGTLDKDEDCKRAIKETVEAFGGLDILVNNGANWNQVMEDNPTNAIGYTAAFQLHVGSIITLVDAAEKELIKSKGVIVNISSAYSHIVSDLPEHTKYFVAKAAQDKLTESQARYFAPLGVRVNAVLPGYTATENTTHIAAVVGMKEEDYKAAGGKLHALGRISEAEEQAAVIVFLASAVSSFCTGSFFVSDGGFHLMDNPFPDLGPGNGNGKKTVPTV